MFELQFYVMIIDDIIQYKTNTYTHHPILFTTNNYFVLGLWQRESKLSKFTSINVNISQSFITETEMKILDLI